MYSDTTLTPRSIPALPAGAVRAALGGIRHERDLLAALRTEGPWTRPASGADGLLHAVLLLLVDRRAAHPAVVGDGAFLSVHEVHRLAAAAQGVSSEADTRDALRQLEAARLVESVGRRAGTPRWRATDHGARTVHAIQA